MRVCIIGGGMAGIICAITASFNSDNKIVVYERQDRIGKKVSITGNGKCNLSNVEVGNSERYTSQDKERLVDFVSTFDNQACVDFYRKLGLVTTVNKGGIYPVSGQALSVVKILENRMRERGIDIICDRYIDSIETCSSGYIVDGEQYDAVVLAFGGKAGIYGENSSCGIEIIKDLGLKGVRPHPALTGVICKCDNKSINGVRVHATVSLYDGSEFLYSDEGELQINENGLSGIPVFNVTNHLPYNIGPDNNLVLVVDYMPEMSIEQLYSYFVDYISMYDTNLLNMMISMFNDKLARYILSSLGLEGDDSVRKLDKNVLMSLVKKTKGYSYAYDSLRNYKNAQVMKGGIDLSELDDGYMLCKYPGIYAIGEMLDISGECGGYNLYFAYHSGRVVGEKLASCKD